MKVKHILGTKFMSILFLFWTVGDMSESKAKKIEIKDVDGQTLSKLIDYIYTAEIEVTEENVQVNSAPANSSVYHILSAPPPARIYIIILFNPHNNSVGN